MGYAIYDIPRPDQPYGKTMRRGYGVEGTCHERGCKTKIDRGLSYLCYRCTWYFCHEHLTYAPDCQHDELIQVDCFAGESDQVCAKCREALAKEEEEYPCESSHGNDAWRP